MNCDYSPYSLPTIDFVGGSTQELVFHTFCLLYTSDAADEL